MRKPNTECCICKKPLYRRPNEIAKTRYFACMEHRVEAQKKAGQTKAQIEVLKMGRVPGTNHRTGYKHKTESKQKSSESHKAWCLANPDKVKERGKKSRGENHYRWSGGVSRLNTAIRLLTENRKWGKAIKERDKRCVTCGMVENLEVHHVTPLSALIKKNGITNIEQARECQELWDLSNGVTMCGMCHCKYHGRKYTVKGQGRRSENKRKDV